MMPDREKMPYETSMSSLLTAIVKQAQEDGRISADESELINRIQIDARDFENAIMEAKKLGGTNIFEIFNMTKDRIIQNATEVAKQDGVITEDEQAIITKLISELETMTFE